MKPLKQRAEEITNQIIVNVLPDADVLDWEAEEIGNIIYKELIQVDWDARENILEAINGSRS